MSEKLIAAPDRFVERLLRGHLAGKSPLKLVLDRRPDKHERAKPGKDDKTLVRFGTKWLDLDAQVLRDENGNEYPLTASEFAILKVFADNPKRVLSRERLLDLANVRDGEVFDRAIDLRIMRIRRKIEPDPAYPVAIRTVRGGGYVFSPAEPKD